MQPQRWFLWIPVFLGIGIGLYFSLPYEPVLWPGLLVLAFCGTAAMLTRNAGVWVFLAACAGFFVSLGFSAALIRTDLVAAPILNREIGPVTVSGRIVAFDRLPAGYRVLLADPVIEHVTPSDRPVLVRIRINKFTGESLSVGGSLSVLARLGPPAAPSLPGGFDFQRQAYFQRLGGIGFALGPASVTAATDRGWQEDIEAIRNRIAQRIHDVLPGPEGAVAAAMLVGEDAAIPANVTQIMRDSGLAHLLTISGLHFGFMAAILFFLLRGGLCLWPRIALRYPTKKWAAMLALAGTGFYLLLSGADIPAIRSFIMTAIVLLAILIDRSAISLRLVALAATGLLLVQPEILLNASFQLSFAAVSALIAFYETRRRPWTKPGLGGRILRYGGNLALGSFIAGTATAPFAWHHFGRFSSYGVAANMLAIPLTGLWIMPFGLLALTLMPLGLERWALIPMGWGIEMMLAIASYVASWPGAVFDLANLPTASLAGVTLGGLWTCIFLGRIRWVGMAVSIVSLIFAVLFHRAPDILVAGDGSLVAVRDGAGNLILSNIRAARRTADAWLQSNGQTDRIDFFSFQEDNGRRLACDALGCLYGAAGQEIALVWLPDALEEDCAGRPLVISLIPVRDLCRDTGQVIDFFDLYRQGGQAIWINAGAIRIETVNQVRGKRPWVANNQPHGTQ